MSIIYLVRHGQANTDGGDYDRLTDLGKTQAQALGEAWVRRGFKCDHVYAGTLRRHRETAEEVIAAYQRAGKDFPALTFDSRFNEIDAYSIVGEIAALLKRVDSEFKDLYEKTKIAFKENAPERMRLFNRSYRMLMEAWMGGRFPEAKGETWEHYSRRVLETQSRLKGYAKEERVTVFTSGTPMGIFVREALELTLPQMFKVLDYLYNTNVTTFIMKQDGVALTSLNETVHLTEEQKTRR